MDRALARALAPADALRRLWLVWAGRWLAPVLVDRERRAALGLFAGVLSAFVLTVTAPLALLAFGPLVLGVPHVLADLRYLVVQPGLHRRLAVVLAVGGPLAVVAYTADPRWGFAAVVGAAGVARGSLARRAAVALVGVALVAVAHRYRWPTLVWFAHAHNLVAVIACLAFGRRFARVAWGVLALYVLVSVGLFAGAAEPFLHATGGLSAPWTTVTVGEQVSVLTPPGFARWGTGFVLFFAFSQSVHYAIWTRVVPDLARPSHTPRSFSQTARALVAELGAPVVGLALLLALAFVGWAMVDLYEARLGYFRFAVFHGYLELGCFALLAAGTGGSAPKKSTPEPEPA